jgi:hypothetical protein
MPIIHSGTDAAFKTNVRNLMHEVGKSPHVSSPQQALAIAYATKRRGRAYGGFSPYMVKPSVNRMEHAEARNMVHGPVLSAVAGRTDHHPVHVPSSSYVLPADHVSSLGQGNTLAGMKQVSRMFGLGGHGMQAPKIKGGMGPPKPPRLPHASGGASDKGGARGHSIGEPTPVAIAGGEIVLPPEAILNWMQANGLPRDIKLGHKALDAWVISQRKRHVKTLQRLPPPAKS